MKTTLLAIMGFAILALAGPAFAVDPPSIINHQGRITVGGVNYAGPTGYFKFVLVDGAGTTRYWDNDGTTGGAPAEPGSAVPVAVSAGHYGVGIGDTTLTNMAALDPDIFADNGDVRLRIYFSTAMGGPFELLTPDIVMNSVGYALNAKIAQGVPDLAITNSMLAAGAVTNSKIAANAVSASKIVANAVGNSELVAGAAAANIDDDGVLGIGLGSDPARGTVHLSGTTGFLDVQLESALVDGVGGFDNLMGASSVAAGGGTTIMVAGVSDDTVTILDVSDPKIPTIDFEITDGSGGFNQFNGPNNIAIAGTTAYVTAGVDDAVNIVDFSNPAAPLLLGFAKDGAGGFSRLNAVSRVCAAGSIVAVSSQVEDAVTIIDVSTPATPAMEAEIVDGAGGFNFLENPADLCIEGNTLYVSSIVEDTVSVIDISTPSSPSLITTISDGSGGFFFLDGPDDLAVVGGVLYVASINEDAVTIIDVSTPASPSLLAVVRRGVGGYGGLDRPNGLHVGGSRLFVTSSFDDTLTIVDVSTPSSPVLLAEVRHGTGPFQAMDNATDIATLGNTAFVAASASASLTIIDVDAANTVNVDLVTESRVGVGTPQALTDFHVEGSAFISGGLYDSSFSQGSAGQVLTSGGTTTEWTTLDHGTLPGLGDDDHPQYVLANGTRAFTGTVGGVTPTNAAHLATKGYVDGAIPGVITDHGALSGLGDDDHPQYFLGNGSEAFGGNLNLGTNDLTNGGSGSFMDGLGVGVATPTNGLLEILQGADTSGDGLAVVNSGVVRSVRLWVDGSNNSRLDSGVSGTQDLALNAGGGNVGVGTSSPESALHAVGSVSPTIKAERSRITSSTTNHSLRLLGKTTTDMIDGFGAGMIFSIEDSAAVENDIAQIIARRAGADNTGEMVFRLYDGGISFDSMILSSGGDLMVGGTLNVGNNDGAGDDFLYFDVGTAEYLSWDNSPGEFDLSDDLHVTGTLDVEGQIIRGETEGAVLGGEAALQLRSDGTLLFMIDEDNNSGGNDQFEWFEDGGTLGVNKLMELQSDGDLRIRGTLSESVAFDIAESFYMAEPLAPGELVRVDPDRPGGVLRSDGKAETAVLGVVSAKPGFLLGGAGFSVADLDVWGAEVRERYLREEEGLIAELLREEPGLGADEVKLRGRAMEVFFERHFAKVALAGRVPVKVDAGFGAIRPGDRLAASPVPGVAMLARERGETIGVALEGLESGAGEVLTFIQAGWHEGDRAEREAKSSRIEELEARLEKLERALGRE